jgi:predicted AlkP superfamily pyrophosphatase or phosphodiesterase
MNWDTLAAPLLAPEGSVLPAGWVQPNYAGAGFANIPATVGALLGTQVGELPPLATDLWLPLAADVQRVILVMVDSLGWRRLAWTDPDFLQGWQAAGGIAAPLTSICPSTTAAATTTLWTGASPAAHGLTGYMQYLPQMGGVCDMIYFRPALSNRTGELLAWGLDPVSLVPVPSVPEWLARANIPTHIVIERSIINGPLSNIHYRGAASRQPHLGASDFWLRLRQLVENQAETGQRSYISGYWALVDSLAHVCGPDDVSWESEWRALRYFLEAEFIARLSPAARHGTLLIITADHGHIPNGPGELIYLSDHPILANMLQTLPAGDPRQVYLWPRRGATADVTAYVQDYLPDFRLFDRDTLLDAGLYGPTIWPEVRARMGELVMFATGRPMFYWRPPRPVYGMHGALLPDEALVPWLIRSLA